MPRNNELEDRRRELQIELMGLDRRIEEDRQRRSVPPHGWRPSVAYWFSNRDADGVLVWHTFSPEGRSFHIADEETGPVPPGTVHRVSWAAMMVDFDAKYLGEYNNQNEITGRPSGWRRMEQVGCDHDDDDDEDDDEPYVDDCDHPDCPMRDMSNGDDVVEVVCEDPNCELRMECGRCGLQVTVDPD